MQRLRDKITIVTAAGSGIGRATALRFAGEGAIVAAFDRSADGLNETIAQIRANGGEGVALEVDVTQSEQIERAIERVIAAYGGIDAVCTVLPLHVADAPNISLRIHLPTQAQQYRTSKCVRG